MYHGLHGFVIFEVARRVIGHTVGLVELHQLPPNNKSNSIEEAVPDYIAYAALLRKSHQLRLQRHGSMEMYQFGREQLPSVEIVQGNLRYYHVKSQFTGTEGSFFSKPFTMRGCTHEIHIDPASGNRALRSEVAREAALIILAGYPPYKGSPVAEGGDPRGMAMVELVRHAPRNIVDTIIASYGLHYASRF